MDEVSVLRMEHIDPPDSVRVESERAATGKSKCHSSETAPSQIRVSPEEALPENYSNLTWPLKGPSSQIGKFQVDPWISHFEYEMLRAVIVCYHSYNGKQFQALRNHIDACT
jgi:hypothetical protein